MGTISLIHTCLPSKLNTIFPLLSVIYPYDTVICFGVEDVSSIMFDGYKLGLMPHCQLSFFLISRHFSSFFC